MSQSVLAIASSDANAHSILARLRAGGFGEGEISIVRSAPDGATSLELAAAPHDAATGAVSGGMMGIALGVMAGVGLITIPGVGPFIAAGPILAALGGVAVGATLGGIAGGLIGLDVPKATAVAYGAKVHAGEVLVAVHPYDAARLQSARAIIADAGGVDIQIVGETVYMPRKSGERDALHL